MFGWWERERDIVELELQQMSDQFFISLFIFILH